jgi:hypothetical protein
MNKRRLTSRNLQMLEAILRYRLMTTEQLHKLIFSRQPEPGTTNSLSNTLRKLHGLEFISRTWVSRSTQEKSMLARPAAVWFFKNENFKKICEELAETGRADVVEDLASLGKALKDSGTLAENTLRHELAITDFYVALEHAAQVSPIALPFWLRTSPKHEDVSRNVTFTKTVTKRNNKTKQETHHDTNVTLPLNPDGFHVLNPQGKGCAFFFLEMDLATETLTEKLTNKFLAYYAYYEQKTFRQDIADIFIARHRLPVARPEMASFRVLFVTPNEKRRNDLLLKSRVLPTSQLFHFATLPDVLADPFGAVWLCKDSFKPYLSEYDRRTHIENPALLRKWAHEALNTTTKHAL